MNKNEKTFFVIVGIIILIVAIVLIVSRNTKTVYTVSFNSNGGTEVSSEEVEKNKTVERPTDPRQEGYEFLGWYLDDKLFDFATAITGNINLEAKWGEASEDEEKTIYKITLNIDGKTSELETDENGLLKKPENPSKEGYKFLGWYVENEKVDFSKAFESDTTIVAKWEKEEEKEEEEENDTSTTEEEENNSEEETTKPEEISVSSVKISKGSLNLEVGETATLTATVSPSNATNKKKSWSSSNSSVARVSSSGTVTAVKAGTATITVTAGGKKATCTVTVTKAPDPITYSIVWVEAAGSAAGQEILYIRSSEGKYVSGTVQITTTAGATQTKSVPASGLTMPRNIVASVSIISPN